MPNINNDKLKIIYGIAMGGMLGFLIYVTLAMKADFTKQLDEVKCKQETILGYYLEVKDELNEVRVQYPKAISEATEKTWDKIDNKIEKLIAWFKSEKDKEKGI